MFLKEMSYDNNLYTIFLNSLELGVYLSKIIISKK